jgi:hypothetical protein
MTKYQVKESEMDRIGDLRNAFKELVWNPKSKKPSRRPIRSSKDNTNIVS